MTADENVFVLLLDWTAEFCPRMGRPTDKKSYLLLTATYSYNEPALLSNESSIGLPMPCHSALRNSAYCASALQHTA